MIGWWLLGEVLVGRSAWTIPNLLATAFYGESAYRSGFIFPTWAGLAAAYAIYSAAGILFAVAGRERQGGWVLLLAGVIGGLALNWFCFAFVFKRLDPIAAIYLPDRLITISHLLYGAALASYPSFLRQLQWVAATPSGFEPPPMPDPAPEPGASEQSGSDQ